MYVCVYVWGGNDAFLFEKKDGKARDMCNIRLLHLKQNKYIVVVVRRIARNVNKLQNKSGANLFHIEFDHENTDHSGVSIITNYNRREYNE